MINNTICAMRKMDWIVDPPLRVKVNQNVEGWHECRLKQSWLENDWQRESNANARLAL